MTPEEVEVILTNIGGYWMLPRDQWEISHVEMRSDKDGEPVTGFISFLRKHTTR